MGATYRRRKEGESISENDLRKNKSGMMRQPKMKPFVKSKDRI